MQVRPIHTKRVKWNSWKSALVEGVFMECLPYAMALCERLLTKEELERSRARLEVALYDSYFSYIGLKVFGDEQACGEAPNLRIESTWHHRHGTECNVDEEGRARGLVLHYDKNNHGFGVVLVFGKFEGFEQLYPALGLKLVAPTLAYVVGSFRDLLHGVCRGTGVRMCVVFATHRTMCLGSGLAGAPHARVDFEKRVYAQG